MSSLKNDMNGKYIKTIKWHGKSMSNLENYMNRKCIKTQKWHGESMSNFKKKMLWTENISKHKNDMAKVCQISKFWHSLAIRKCKFFPGGLPRRTK